MNTLIICDIDGVLADCTHRLHYAQEKDYDSFYGVAMADDAKIEFGVVIMRTLKYHLEYHSADLIFLTGRPERTRKITELWLSTYAGAYPSDLSAIIMRKDGDYRSSKIVKVELLQDILRPVEQTKRRKVKRGMHEYDRVLFIDDDPKNVIAVCETYPEVQGLTFGIKRMNRNE